jgi:hypothetical protein
MFMMFFPSVSGFFVQGCERNAFALHEDRKKLLPRLLHKRRKSNLFGTTSNVQGDSRRQMKGW